MFLEKIEDILRTSLGDIKSSSLIDSNLFASGKYGLLQKLEVIQRSLNPIYDEAQGFLTHLENKSAKSTFKLR